MRKNQTTEDVATPLKARQSGESSFAEDAPLNSIDLDPVDLDPLHLDPLHLHSLRMCLDLNDPASDGADLPQLQAALQSYKRETLHWAEQRSAAMPPPQVRSWARSPRWALAWVAMLGCGMGVLWHTQGPEEPAAVAVTAPTAQALAEDEQLLQSVDAALDGGTNGPTAEELGLTQTRGTTNTPGRVAQWTN